jgi:dihydropteroate synthase
MEKEQIHFVTGRLAEPALREIVGRLAERIGFGFTVQVMPITVAALLTPQWMASRLEVPPGTTRILLPGFCAGDLRPLQGRTEVPIELGPKDLRDLPAFFSQPATPPDWSQYDIEILAEINYAPRLHRHQLLDLARQYAAAGADLIDVGCEPTGGWRGVGDAVRAIKDLGLRVSIDSFDREEVEAAVGAGAELVLSVNSGNREWAADTGAALVVIPDRVEEWERLEESAEYLAARGCRWRADPILEPIGLGFAGSLQRYYAARQRWPEAEVLMGIGNVTELSDCDSAGINFLLLAICQELGIHSVLTTQVINWARTSVAECDWARRLVKHAVSGRVPPKRLLDRLVMLRDPRVTSFGRETLAALAEQIKDANLRLFAEPDGFYALAERQLWSAEDPFELFDLLSQSGWLGIDPSHAFYLGYELCKAEIARQLGKQYTQDEALSWGLATVDERKRHRLKRRRNRDAGEGAGEGAGD